MRGSGEPAEGLVANDDPGPVLGVHLLAGLPTEAVRWGFARTRDMMPVVPLEALAGFVVGDATRIGVLLPPFVEPALVVENFEECDFLTYRFGRPARIEGVSTFVDVQELRQHLASTDWLSSRGWGRGDLDRRTVADILVEQIEAATQLVLVGAARASESLARCLALLNPGASRIPCSDGSGLDLKRLGASFGLEEPVAQGGSDHTRRDAPEARSVRVVPRWLEVLRGELDPAPKSDVFVYRRARPFDEYRLRDWLADPPGELLRGKGHVWLAGEPDRSFGYSCAGSAHRLYEAGRWWASQAAGAWPSCATQRRKLLERWHPRFGDRRQELVFLGVDLEPDRLYAGLDACLVAEAEVDDSLHASRAEGSGAPSTSGSRLH